MQSKEELSYDNGIGRSSSESSRGNESCIYVANPSSEPRSDIGELGVHAARLCGGDSRC